MTLQVVEMWNARISRTSAKLEMLQADEDCG